MALKLEINGEYATTNGIRVRVLGQVSSDHIGITKTINRVKVFVPVPFFRCRFLDTNEIVFYSQYGSVLSAEHNPGDRAYHINKRLS